MTYQSAPAAEALDWDAAAWWAQTLTPVGPTATRGQATRVAGYLRGAASQAPEIVAGVTGLDRASQRAGQFPRLVVDRRGWAKANVEMFSGLIGGHVPVAHNYAVNMGTALELGGLLALLATRVLGQFDPFSSRLYLVAPNIIQVRRNLRVNEEDFAMWVALHEQTHAVQFAAAPWLPDYMRSELGALLDSVSADPNGRVWQTIRRLPNALRRREEASVGLLTQAALSEAESEQIERIVAVMSMLEGHADVVMDSAESAVPSTRNIRDRFTQRRTQPRMGDMLLRRLIGMDAKLRQYQDGAAFVSGVIAHAGHEGFNRVFDQAENLPSPDEIAHPQRWVERVAP